ncbi:hypothetical protein FO440_10045 [Mucilaginibacter corticis]|uniref:6-phosphogluconate dehydrogenase n=1 Tax=Mucilaginibacter corticis TaxID=2597670 RepID=A0A556MX28_9SPHI|nr:hypothetical protein [Mucilaginibacter corticis]TSJ44494.1 hypothetical protein FO440_10045 [Mucilaginibacter corticis]
MTTKKKIIYGLITILTVVLVGIVYYRYYFVFGEGVKAGQLNYFVKKGYVFKTAEGRLILAGIQSQQPGNITSNEFIFSVTDDKVAAKLDQNAGAFVQLHYKEYLHALPWRGFSHFVVDSVVSAVPAHSNP